MSSEPRWRWRPCSLSSWSPPSAGCGSSAGTSCRRGCIWRRSGPAVGDGLRPGYGPVRRGLRADLVGCPAARRDGHRVGGRPGAAGGDHAGRAGRFRGSHGAARGGAAARPGARRGRTDRRRARCAGSGARPRLAFPPPRRPVDIRLRGATVRHSPDGPPALDHVDLDLRPGYRVALVGATGAGKSALAASCSGSST
jgi:hypothetical protein